MSRQRTYVEEVGHALMAFQMIEEILKREISLRHMFIEARVKAFFPFRSDEKDLENAALERLISLLRTIGVRVKIRLAVKGAIGV